MSVKQLVSDTGVSCHAWNGDFTQLAYSPNSNELRIVDVKTWEVQHSLTEHDMLIAAIDWHATSNFIVTVGHDRNAFVWTYDAAENAWKPLLVILRIERAALDVKWSPDGSKFAVASSAKCVPVCYYETGYNWWVSKMIKKHKSTVLALAWHPNSQLVATGSSDFKCRVFSAYVSNVDGETQVSAEFGEVQAFGEPYAEFAASGWVHAVAYSPSGNTLAFAGHDSSVHFATFAGGTPVVQTIRFGFLPLTQVLFHGENRLFAGGHDMNPAVFDLSGEWAFSAFVDVKEVAKEVDAAAENSVKGRMNMWQNKDKTGTAAGSSAGDATSWLKHQGAISCIKAHPDGFSTTSVDGRLVVWTNPN
ncbi:WD40-repeat-containing domain protein [Pelagophyceae sp. CCMP2097]|nr:WD40-repeat-containing domain protein [Pelagophyceae sp. CCMP2097]|mmetsp:Transcript_27812/g.93519  ORF Transcript_27812/g.93519 Transcript_27812/m.93519 type:complete len:361 (+) Transcript_27812:62-1144(+)